MNSPANDRRIDYIEFTASDIEKAKAFYGSAFGWQFTDYGPEYTSFADGRLSGGFTKVESGGGARRRGRRRPGRGSHRVPRGEAVSLPGSGGESPGGVERCWVKGEG